MRTIKLILLALLIYLNGCIQINMPPVDDYIAILISLAGFKKSNPTQSSTPASDSVPPTISYSGSPYVLTLNLPVNSVIPTITGTITSCTSAPTLPAGLTLNNTTCAISGTPTAVQSATNYVISASNSAGSAPVTISITINEPPPSALAYSGSPYTMTISVAITAITPTVTGTVTNCVSSPTLPAGLSLNMTTCAISGMPTTLQAATSYTITASNAGGNTTATISITVNPPRFTVTYIGNSNTGGTVPTDSNSYLQGDTVTVKSNSGILNRTPPAQTAEAFKFGEWNTAANGSGTTYTAGTGTFTMGSSNVTLYAKWIPYVLGDTGPAGGLIFYDSGSFHSDGNGNWRYLEAATADLGSVSMKSAQTLTAGTGTAIGTGKANTTLLIASGISPAATLCVNHNGGGYTDWFFPSIIEMWEMYNNLYVTGRSSFTADVTYWSSSENTASYAWYVHFTNANQAVWFKTSSSGIRAARAF